MAALRTTVNQIQQDVGFLFHPSISLSLPRLLGRQTSTLTPLAVDYSGVVEKCYENAEIQAYLKGIREQDQDPDDYSGFESVAKEM